MLRDRDDELGFFEFFFQDDLIGEEIVVIGEAEGDIQNPRDNKGYAGCANGEMGMNMSDTCSLCI